ncbi:unnamed protein product [Lathyrus sativus]|nr:unnamed protein product [Lathyrus sativus]CAK8070843.1 unnamed protein product [Lathyrus sativus]CAK8079809.1 unnamed protein product [Lathyrus sativus]
MAPPNPKVKAAFRAMTVLGIRPHCLVLQLSQVSIVALIFAVKITVQESRLTSAES